MIYRNKKQSQSTTIKTIKLIFQRSSVPKNTHNLRFERFFFEKNR